MYSIQLPSGSYLELNPGTQLNFELQSSIFTGSDTSVLPGSFTFPVDLPASATNRILLGFPENVHTPGIPAPIEGVWIYAFGQAMFFGTLTIRSATASRINVSIVANPIASIKDTQLNQLYLGDDVLFNTAPVDMPLFMKNTVRFPDDYNYAFLPVENVFFFGEITPTTFTSGIDLVQNYWEATTESFEMTSKAIMPMVRLDYVLRQLIESSAEGWSLVNDFQTTTELRHLYLWNNFNLWTTEDGTSTISLAKTFNLKNHVSATKGNEFLKKLTSLFCLGVFTNPFNKTIKIKPLQEVLSAPFRYDWTGYAIEGAGIEFENGTLVDKFCHKAPPLVNRYLYGYTQPEYQLETYNLSDDLSELTSFASFTEYDAAYSGLAVGLYYVESNEAVIYKREIDGFPGTYFDVIIGFKKKCKVVADGENEYTPGIETPYFANAAGIAVVVLGWDTVRLEKTGNYWYEEDATDHIWRRTGDAMDDVLFFYRGLQTNYGGDLVPLCSDNDRSLDGTTVCTLTEDGTPTTDAEYSLRWHGDQGLYNKYWSLWHDLLANGKPVSMRFTIPVAKLVEFSFEDKIRVDKMDYFVKSLRIAKLTADGRFLVEAKLFSTI